LDNAAVNAAHQMGQQLAPGTAPLRPENVAQAYPLVPGVNAIPGGGPFGDKKGPVEFNHAINYVNKIKVFSFMD
jgi:hypothetical protein